jgi:hypothetical protein
LAAPFALAAVVPGGRRHVIVGVFTWAAVGLDRPDGRRDRTWFDIGMRPEEAKELLQQRIYELDTAP